MCTVCTCATPAGTLLPPKKKFPEEVRGYQEPSGAGQTQKQDRTHWNKTVHRNRKPSWAGSEAEASSGHDQESGALTGSLSDRLHFCDSSGAGGSSCCGRRGHSSRLPQTSLRGQDRQDWIKTAPVDTTRLKTCLWGHGTALLAVMWTRSKGIGLAAASGLESAPIWRAWVSGDPAGLSQRRSGRLESAAIRRALSQRRAGGHWVSGDPVAWSPANGAPRGAATREPGNQPAGLGEPPPAADISRDRRAWGLAASGLAALAAIPPNSHTDLQWAKAGITSGDFHAAAQTQTQEQNKTLKNEKQNEVKGRRLRLGLVFCHGAHTREEQEHGDEDLNSNNSL